MKMCEVWTVERFVLHVKNKFGFIVDDWTNAPKVMYSNRSAGLNPAGIEYWYFCRMFFCLWRNPNHRDDTAIKCYSIGADRVVIPTNWILKIKMTANTLYVRNVTTVSVKVILCLRVSCCLLFELSSWVSHRLLCIISRDTDVVHVSSIPFNNNLLSIGKYSPNNPFTEYKRVNHFRNGVLYALDHLSVVHFGICTKRIEW